MWWWDAPGDAADAGHIFRYRMDRGKGSGHSTHIRCLSGLAYLNPKDSDVYRNNAGGLDSTPSGSHLLI